MLGTDRRGIVGLPVILIICVFLASVTVAVGFEGLKRLGSMKKDQEAINCFERLVRSATRVGYGRVGEREKIKVDTGGYGIRFDGRLIELREGDEVLRAERLPLPVRIDGKQGTSIDEGSYWIRLERTSNFFDLLGEGDLFLKLEEIAR